MQVQVSVPWTVAVPFGWVTNTNGSVNGPVKEPANASLAMAREEGVPVGRPNALDHRMERERAASVSRCRRERGLREERGRCGDREEQWE